MITLYDWELSAPCWSVRQLLAYLGLAHDKVAVNAHPAQAHRSADFMARLSPLGQLPVLDDDGYRLHDAQAILVYLASSHDGTGRWFPADAMLRGQVMQWLSVAQALNQTAGAARAHDALGRAQTDIDAARAGARQLFRLLDDHLAERHSSGHTWLVGEHLSLADLACFPHAALAQDGGLTLDACPALRHWIWDLRHAPGYIGLAGIMPPDPALAPLRPGPTPPAS
jgi:glutathione S-transferase